MLFYVPEWDDAVDPDYDFTNDEQSVLLNEHRDTEYIWDTFPAEAVPIDGVLFSREHVESTAKTTDRLLNNGVYADEQLDLPEWLPTISDCGAWGYRDLPFPPYANEEMLEFYEQLGVTTGVTIDHLLFADSPDTTRLYLDESAFTDDFTPTDLPDHIHEHADVMITDWPDSWPEYVTNYEPSLSNMALTDGFSKSLFEGSIEDILSRLENDPRAVYRKNDTQFRYDLTLKNAKEMRTLYEQGNWSFRLMGVVQGWNTGSYQSAAQTLLNHGYSYLGIGGVATKPANTVKSLLTSLNQIISTHETTETTRVGVHVFGFSKTDALQTAGAAGASSFDSASMLRSAWTGGNNYHLENNKYDAFRVRYPGHTDSLKQAIEKSLASQTLVHALHAYDNNNCISDQLHDWLVNTHTTLQTLEQYLVKHRHDNQFNSRHLREVESAFRNDYAHGKELQASFSSQFRREIVKLLRSDTLDNPVPVSDYKSLLNTAHTVFSEFNPPLQAIRDAEHTNTNASLDALWPLIDWYTTLFDDTHLTDAYQELLTETPWKDCNCRICTEHGIDIALFRGNDRNRRRGFHNTYQFYREFNAQLPKTAVVTLTNSLPEAEPIETHLKQTQPDFWNATHDLPVVELGTLTGTGLYEWWQTTNNSPAKTISDLTNRYNTLYIHTPNTTTIPDTLQQSNCTIHTFNDPEKLASAVTNTFDFNISDDLAALSQLHS